MQESGYRNNLGLIEDVARNHDVIIEQADNGRLMFVQQDQHQKYVIAEYHPSTGLRRLTGKKDEYSVTTGFPEASRNVGKAHRTSEKHSLKRGGSVVWEKK